MSKTPPTFTQLEYFELEKLLLQALGSVNWNTTRGEEDIEQSFANSRGGYSRPVDLRE